MKVLQIMLFYHMIYIYICFIFLVNKKYLHFSSILWIDWTGLQNFNLIFKGNNELKTSDCRINNKSCLC